MAETPSWLTNDASTPAPATAAAAPAKTETSIAVASSASASASASESPPAAAASEDPATLADTEREQLRGIILFTRLINLAVSVAVITHAIISFIGLPNPKFWVLGFYSFVFGSLICCLETQLKFVRTIIAINFGFLFDPFLRFLFYMLVATVEFSFKTIFGHILAGSLVGVAFYNTFVLIKYPAYRRLRDQIAKEEDLRIEGKIRAKVRKEATAAMFQGGGAH
eukprot:CAMPEP_0197247532 /NCGR_PEP_ID=MMETSP1429-20130617/29250_1 /TAXON_ID=49237 /ORGANISM="Chaetoceros  sp., Strain UNC1202" /LENGTH=223 /DNA_ID=CAMNT_0042708451 /DNA_START=44 /DNA_END=715 /DNA_ORIENTATION=+